IDERSVVAATPTGASPHNSPASTPCFAGSYTTKPTSSRSGSRITSRNARVPMLPVAHWTTRSVNVPLLVPSAPRRSPRRLREGLELEEFVQARAAHLATHARLLVAAERCVGAVVHATVHTHR